MRVRQELSLEPFTWTCDPRDRMLKPNNDMISRSVWGEEEPAHRRAPPARNSRAILALKILGVVVWLVVICTLPQLVHA